VTSSQETASAVLSGSSGGITSNAVPWAHSQNGTAIPGLDPATTTTAWRITASTAISEASAVLSKLATPAPPITLREISQAAVHDVEIGAFGQLIFNPNQVTADVGDIVRFTFRSFNHSLVQSSLEQPCVPNDQFHSGFRQFNAADSKLMMLSFTVNSPEPQFFFCQQTTPVSHCDRGMVFAINPGEDMGSFLDNVSHESQWKAESATANASFPTLAVGKGPEVSGVSFAGIGTPTGASVSGVLLKSVSSNVAISTGDATSNTVAPFLSRMVWGLLLVFVMHAVF